MSENFEAGYARQLELYKEFERIEVAYAKIKDKYKAYDECQAFIDYIRSMEKVFAEARAENWNADKSKDEIIMSEITLLAQRSRLDENVFRSIYDDFKKANASVAKVYDAISDLKEKHKDCPDCLELISYIEYVFIIFSESRTGTEGLEAVKRGLIQAKINVLSADGHPEMKMLENIYHDFRNLISR